MRKSLFSRILAIGIVAFAILVITAASRAADPVPVDRSAYRAECGVSVLEESGRLFLDWPIADGESGRLVLDLHPGAALIERVAINADGARNATTLLEGVDPVTFLVVGSRVNPPDRPPTMSVFNVFFDAPAKRPHQAYRSRLEPKHAKLASQGRRASVALDGLTVGPFSGELVITIYTGARLVHVEAVVTTQENERAILYDAGLVSAGEPSWRGVAWRDTEGVLHRDELSPTAHDQLLAVRHRTIIAESRGGTVACFPPPHQYFFPRDLTENLSTVWSGRGHRSLEERVGFGIRQSETGGGSFVPWINAPPGTHQRLGVFYLLSRGAADDALGEVLRYTHGDRFPELPGHVTFTSHWHMAIAVAAMKELSRGAGRTTPDFVRMFKDMGVQIVHLAEFHGDGHPGDPGPLRLPEMEAMFAECRRLSDDRLLLLPGEEANVYFGIARPGQHPGHWLYLFPKPVYWTMHRAAGQPFAQEKPPYGTVYNVGSADDMARLIEREQGLAWTAHARIKASNWAPDAYRNESYYRSPNWLGAAWKAMPSDLSRDRLGERVLDLFDDMANWGGPKYVLGEVDVFKLDHTHELYGHMNINYLKLDRILRFDEGWTPVLDALRQGRFFVTTGEVLIRDFTVAGKHSGDTLAAADTRRPETKLELEWTFPMRFVEVISGDGSHVYRERTDLSDTGPFGKRTVSLTPELRGRRWVRAEAWDIAGNGAFTQPVWLRSGATR